MPTDSHGNEYVCMWGRSHVLTTEQKMRMIFRDHADRCCCDDHDWEHDATMTEQPKP